MLVLSRKVGEQICVPQFDIVLTVLAVHGQRVSLGIEAPASIRVVRSELLASSPQRLTGSELSVNHSTSTSVSVESMRIEDTHKGSTT
jgi:carbon storage regulator CsrA